MDRSDGDGLRGVRILHASFLAGLPARVGLCRAARLAPRAGLHPTVRGLWPFLRQLVLPALTLGFVYVALITRMTRASMLTVLREDYIRTAYAKGLPPPAVLLRHALKNAGLPVSPSSAWASRC